MNWTFFYGVCAGWGIGMFVGCFLGMYSFRRGVEDGLRLHGLLEKDDDL